MISMASFQNNVDENMKICDDARNRKDLQNY